MYTMTVAPGADASGSFYSLKAAFAAMPEDPTVPVTIRVMPGIYHEKLSLTRPNVTIEGAGASPSDTVISFGDYGYEIMPDGIKRGTFRSYTFFVHAADVTLRNLTIENTAGDSKTHGQAIALYAECDRFIAESCRILGHQDTLFTGPLPPEEYEPGGFRGPTESAPRINGRQYYHNCYICGDIDFIFGSATAYFEGCTIASLGPGYVTAASTPEGQEYGYVFHDCRFAAEGCPQHAAYIGRPWRDYARVVLMDCAIGAHIHPAGFHDWGKEHAHGTVLFAEYHSYPQDADCGCADSCRPFAQRADFVDTLDGAFFQRACAGGGRRLAAVTVFLYIPPNDGKILTINGLFCIKEVVFMEEKIYKTMGSTGAASLAVGICVLTGGIAAGILLIVNGARLLKNRAKIIF